MKTPRTLSEQRAQPGPTALKIPIILSIAVTYAIAPTIAVARPLTPVLVLARSTPAAKVIMLALAVALIAAVCVTVGKLRSGPLLSGGSAFLSALRIGGPLLGLLGAAFNGLTMFIGMANKGPQPIEVLAPGLAEAALMLVFGLIVGVAAVALNWAIEARVDRMVLKV